MNQFFALALFLSVAAHATSNDESKTIAPLNLLLPTSSEDKAEYTIHAFGGCYKMSSSDPLIVSLSQMSSDSDIDECHNKAVARVELFHAVKSTVWLIAEEVKTGIVLRCEARIANLARIEITTRSRVFEVGVLETIELTGFDHFGNVFSTLEGLKFEWKIKQDSDIVELSSFRHSSLQVSNVRTRIEREGQLSDQIVLKTKNMGRLTLEVTPTDPMYKSISNSVTLSVIEQIAFQPEDRVVIAKCSSIQLKAYVLKGDRKSKSASQIKTLDRFLMIAENDTLVKVDDMGRIKCLNQIGETQLNIVDRSHEENVYRIQIKVVSVETLQLSIHPIMNDDWLQIVNLTPNYGFDVDLLLQHYEGTMIVGKAYVLRSEVNSKSKEMVMLDQERLNWAIQRDEIEILFSNSQFMIIKPLKAGTFEVRAELVKNECEESEMSAIKQIESYLPIILLIPRNEHNEIYLPSPAETIAPQKYSISSIGGTGNIKCESSDISVVDIERLNTLIAISVGKSIIKCADTENDRNSDEFIVVVELSDTVSIEEQNEALQNMLVSIPWKAITKNDRLYANCTQLSAEFNIMPMEKQGSEVKVQSAELDYNAFLDLLFEHTKTPFISRQTKRDPKEFKKKLLNEYLVSNQLILEQFQTAIKGFGICGFIQTKLEKIGLHEIKSNNQLLIESNAYIKVHSQLTVTALEGYDEDIFTNKPLLSYGTLITYSIKGGPSKWSSKNSKLIRVTTNDDSKIVTTSFEDLDEVIRVKVKCNSRDQLSTLKNFDIDSVHNVAVHIIVQNEITEQMTNPQLLSSNLIVQCSTPKALKAISVKQTDFTNYKWIEKFSDVVYVQSNKIHLFSFWVYDTTQKPFWNFTAPTPSVQMSNSTFTTKINTKFDRYADHGSSLIVLNVPKSSCSSNMTLSLQTDSKKESIISTSIKIKAVDTFRVEPTQAILILSSKCHVVFTIMSGSGIFKVSIDDESIASISYDSRAIKVSPVRVGKTRIRVIDTKMEISVELDIEVIGLDELHILLLNSLIQNKQETELRFMRLPSLKDQLALLSLQFIISPANGLQITKHDTLNYSIRANQVGEYTIQIQMEEQILTKSHLLRVYEELSTFPSKLVLMPNGVTIFKLLGGPKDMYTSDYEIRRRSIKSSGTLNEQGFGVYNFEAGNVPTTDKLVLDLIYNGKHLTSIEVDVIVAYPNDISINGPFKLLVGASAIVQAFPKFNEDEFSLGFCIASTTVNIDSDDSIVTLSSLTIDYLQNPCFISILVKANKIGMKKINFELKSELNGKWTTLSKSFQVKVIANHDLKTIELLNQYKNSHSNFGDNSYMIAPNTQLQIPLDLQLTINYLDNVITMIDVNTIKSTNKIGKDSITLVDIDSEAKSSTHVIVVSPSFLVVQDIQKSLYLEENSLLIMKIGYMDDVGRLFSKAATTLNLEILTSDLQVAEIKYNESKAEFSVRTKKSGKSIIYVKSKDFPNLTCVITLIVGSIITPNGNVVVHVGAQIDFKSRIQNAKLNNGFWSSSDQNVVEIDSTTGKALAIGKGNAEIYWNGIVIPQVKVTVIQIESLKIVNQNATLTNIDKNTLRSKPYIVEFEPAFKTDDLRLTVDKAIHDNLVFDCSPNTTLVLAKPERQLNEKKQDRFKCAINMLSANELIPDFRLTSEVVSTTVPFKVTSIDTIKVHSRFLVVDKKITLSKREPSRSIHIKTLSKLLVTFSTELVPFASTTFNAEGKVQVITIEFPNEFNEQVNAWIEVHNEESKQVEKIEVNFEKTISPFWFISEMFSPVLKPTFNDCCMFILCILILYGVFKALLNQKDESMDSSIIGMSTSRYSKIKRD